ncbi:MAG: hypothetical protein ACOX6D_03955 [Thermoguttaceae bacterium]
MGTEYARADGRAKPSWWDHQWPGGVPFIEPLESPEPSEIGGLDGRR